ncbi:hypothetical protein CDO44_10135 [Pigmentiphaga sp. NML080357]|uniref:hypothetical protein n=1 Tax=Pigmentiphaga sp. NML080357 TaxID=2008675 RepID=UPI000B41DF2B|nr:hypothetical protein [Pigmentiphaga sp. NML080357]OVZ59921.1 hypothetical protein CDO44_10135 [Pigmentiphaga sp. NML080357]
MNTKSKHRASRLAMAALGAILLSSAQAASDGQAAYREEVARCNSGKSGQDRATCLREAGAALQEARRGNLRGGDASGYERNRTQRCNALPEADRPACIARAEGRGTVTGSVEGGGVLREYREIVTPAPSSPAMPSGSPGPATPGSGGAPGMR